MADRSTEKLARIVNAYEEGPDSLVKSLKPAERNITLFEERVLRCVHHEFDAMTHEEAACALNVSPSTISRTLSDLEERAKTCTPIQIMFPILTELQFEVYTSIVKHGLSAVHTASALDLTESAVNKMMTTMRDKGMNIPKRCNMPKSKSYTPSMDKEVKHKF